MLKFTFAKRAFDNRTMKTRCILLVITKTISTLPLIHSARAETVTFTESSTHHKPVIRWGAHLAQPSL